MNKHLHSLQALLLTVLMLMAGNALAQKPYSYSPSGPITIKTGYGGQNSSYVSITNISQAPIKVWVNLYGDSNFSFAYAQWSPFTISPDSTGDLPVTYQAWPGDTSTAWLIISDSLAKDTIQFVGIDSGISNSSNWSTSTETIYLGTYFQQPDSAFFSITNHGDDSVEVELSLLSTNGISFTGPASRTILGGSSETVLVKFASNIYNTSDNVLHVSSGGAYRDVSIHAGKYNPPHDTLTFQQYLTFDTVAIGDTVCRTVMIVNRFDSSATIDSIGASLNTPFYITDLPSMPYTLASHDTLIFTVCYVAPASGNQYSYGSVSLLYRFAGDSLAGQSMGLFGITKGCFLLRPGFVQFNGIDRDSSQTQSVYLYNQTNSTLTIDADFDPSGGGHFEVLTSMPINLAAHDSQLVYIRFTAVGANQQYAKLIFDGGNNCGTMDLGLSAWINDSNIVIDSNDIGLFADQTSTLQFFGDSSHTSVTYRFYNDQNDSIKVVSVSLKDGSHFTITDIAPHNPWFKLAPSDLMSLTVEFDGTPGTYTDTLVIVTEDGIIALTFPIHAVINASEVATPVLSAASMTVSPNPSSGPVNIAVQGANAATIEVLDIMGKPLAQFASTSATFDRTAFAAGTYFVRATGIGQDRKPFVITTRVVLR